MRTASPVPRQPVPAQGPRLPRRTTKDRGAPFDAQRLEVLRHAFIEPDRRLRVVVAHEEVRQLVLDVLAGLVVEVATDERNRAPFEVVTPKRDEKAGRRARREFGVALATPEVGDVDARLRGGVGGEADVGEGGEGVFEVFGGAAGVRGGEVGLEGEVGGRYFGPGGAAVGGAGEGGLEGGAGEEEGGEAADRMGDFIFAGSEGFGDGDVIRFLAVLAWSTLYADLIGHRLHDVAGKVNRRRRFFRRWPALSADAELCGAWETGAE